MVLSNYLFSLKNKVKNSLIFETKDKKLEIRLMVLEEDIIRILFIPNSPVNLEKTWLVAPGREDVPYQGRDRLDLSLFSLPDFTYESNDHEVTVQTSLLRAVIELDGFKIHWFIKYNDIWINIANDRKTQNYNFNNNLGKGVFHYLERRLDEQYFGLGEKAGKTNRHGKRYRMMNLDPMGYDAENTDPLYKHIPFYITRNMTHECCFGIFYDNMTTSTFEMGSELDNYHGYYRYYHAEGGDLDYYMLAGPSISNVVKRFSWLTGKSIFQPKWALGYSGSTMSYTDAPNAQEQLETFIDDCEKHNIPCDSFQLSSGYTSINDKRYVFNWNYDKIPQPTELTKQFHQKGLRLCANIKPCLLHDHPHFNILKENKMFILAANEDTPEMAQFWDDLGAYLDFTNPKTIEWWKDNVKTQLLHVGIDSTWNDNNEYEIWDSNARVNGFGQGGTIGTLKPIQTLLMLKSSFDAQKEYAPNLRPYLISRSGCPGMQRYVQTWSGDNRTDWKTIQYNIKMGIGLSLSGIYNFGHDVGGFSGPAPDPEMFVRWVQNGIFHPRLTIHSWNDDGSANVPWMYPEMTKYVRNLILFRTKIIPYIYHLLYRSHIAYDPVILPTFYYFEHDSNTFEENDDFMLGESMLIGSVVKKGQYQRTIYLPQNQHGWYDFHTQVWYESGQEITIPAPLEYTPLLIQGNSIIPINDAPISFSNKEDDSRGFIFFPSKTEAIKVFDLYEDDGISMDYKKGSYANIQVKMESTLDTITIHTTISEKGKFTLPYNKINLYFMDAEYRNIIINAPNVKKFSPQKYTLYFRD